MLIVRSYAERLRENEAGTPFARSESELKLNVPSRLNDWLTAEPRS